MSREPRYGECPFIDCFARTAEAGEVRDRNVVVKWPMGRLWGSYTENCIRKANPEPTRNGIAIYHPLLPNVSLSRFARSALGWSASE